MRVTQLLKRDRNNGWTTTIYTNQYHPIPNGVVHLRTMDMVILI